MRYGKCLLRDNQGNVSAVCVTDHLGMIITLILITMYNVDISRIGKHFLIAPEQDRKNQTMNLSSYFRRMLITN